MSSQLSTRGFSRSVPLQPLLDALEAPVTAIAADGRLAYANAAFGNLVGMDPEALHGTRAPFPFWPEQLRASYTALFQSMLVCSSLGRDLPTVAPMELQHASGRRIGARIFRMLQAGPDGPLHVSLVQEAAGGAGNPRLERVEKSLQRIAEEVSRLSLWDAAPPSGEPPEWEELSRRENEVLVELLAGHETGEIGRRLCISRHTVRNHLKAIFRKLDVHSQRELMARYHGPSIRMMQASHAD